MPEHFHLLITEPEVGDPSVVMKVIKERFSKQVHASEKNAQKAHSFAQNANEWGTHADQKGSERIWQKRFYDFNVWSAHKQTEKIKYMHRNPVKRGVGGPTRTVALEQFSGIPIPRDGAGAGEVSRMGLRDQAPTCSEFC
jgi:REP element-mobilizing transposase RayT